ncbi:MAG: ketoacyl-ACP synthase III [Flavobacteriaceae bacterium]|jgi:3-oxoacyl-[acyl-carrier-protein] synthase-3|nr:ketoacyl-ACP synthase III [Flavobacteriaceae bacterium]
MLSKSTHRPTRAIISAIGGYVPEGRRTNEDLERITDTNNEWIIKRTGIKERRILSDGLATSDMAVQAIRNLAITYQKDISKIDALIVATSTPDMPMPTTANIICHKLGIQNVWAFDVNAACSGFLYTLDLGASLIETGRYKNVVVIGADKISAFVNINDRATNILFGDGAGAVWLEPSTENGILDALLLSNGIGQPYLNIEGGGSLHPIGQAFGNDDKQYLKQDGKIVFKHAVQSMSDACLKVVERNQLSISQVDWVIPHQANQRIIDAVGRQINIEEHKTLSNIAYYGNTIAATIPLCMWENKDKFKKNDLIMLTAFGAGFSWGASLLHWAI